MKGIQIRLIFKHINLNTLNALAKVFLLQIALAGSALTWEWVLSLAVSQRLRRAGCAAQGRDKGSYLPTAPGAPCVSAPAKLSFHLRRGSAHSHSEESRSYAFSTLYWASFTPRKYLALACLCILAAKQKYRRSELRMLQSINEDDKTVLNYCVCFTAYTFLLPSCPTSRGCLAVLLLRWRPGAWTRARAKSKFRIPGSPCRAQQPSTTQPPCSPLEPRALPVS